MAYDPDDEIGSWNGQRTPTADKLAGCTWWIIGFIALMFFGVVFVSPAIEALLQWWRG